MHSVLRVQQLSNLFRQRGVSGLQALSVRQKATAVEKKEADVYTTIEEEDYELALLEKEQEIQQRRNKSRLNPQHRNIIHFKVPFEEPMDDVHLTLKYKRKMFGRYGKQTNIDPGTLWPNEEDIRKVIEYEKIAFPNTILEAVAKQKQKIEDEKKIILERQEKILNNLKKLSQWRKEIEDRAAKKLADFEKAKSKKDALIEEVKKHFGYNVDPKDEKFKEMLLAKERAQKKKLKEERAKAKHERMLQEIMRKES